MRYQEPPRLRAQILVTLNATRWRVSIPLNVRDAVAAWLPHSEVEREQGLGGFIQKDQRLPYILWIYTTVQRALLCPSRELSWRPNVLSLEKTALGNGGGITYFEVH